jgi:hypothetical protein
MDHLSSSAAAEQLLMRLEEANAQVWVAEPDETDERWR